MAGRVQWEAQVDSNVAKLLSETKELRNELETINKKDIKLDIDSKSLNSIVDLFGKMESHLKDLKKVFVDVGDGAEFSPLLKTINNIQSSIKELSASVKNIGFNMNIDFGSDTEMEAKIQSKISNALQAYQRLFDHIKMSSVGGAIINTKFFDFDINQYDTMMGKLQAYKKFIDNMRKEAKSFFGGQDVLYQDTEKSYWTAASSAMGQVTKAFNEMNVSTDTSPLENLFGKTDLTEVVAQLNLIVDKLGEISTIASEFKNAFANGFNVSASVEEIEKLTSRVKELEDELSKVKVSPTSPVETNISSGEILPTQELDSVVKKYQEIVSLVKEYYELSYKLQKPTKEFQTRPEDYDRIDGYLLSKSTSQKVGHTDVERDINKRYHEMSKGINEGKEFAIKAMKSAIQSYWSDVTEMPSDDRLLSSRKIIPYGNKNQKEEYIIPKKYQELEKSVIEETIALNKNNAAYEEERRQIEANNTAIKERMNIIRSMLKSEPKNKDYDGDYRMGLSLKANDGKTDIFNMTQSMSYEDMLKEICNMLGVEIPKASEKAQSALKEVADVQKTQSSTPIEDTFQGDVKESAESSAPAVKEEVKAMEQVAESAKKASKGKDEFSKANKKVKESADSSSKAVSEEATEFNKIIGKLDGYQKKLDSFKVKPTDGHRYPIYQKNINELNEYIDKLQTLSQKDINLIKKEDVSEAQALQKEIDELIFKMSKMSASEKGFDPLGADKALEKIHNELQKNSGMSKEAKRQIQSYYDEIRSGNPSKPIKDLLDDMYKLIQLEREAGRAHKSFNDIFKEKVIYGAAANLAGMIGIYDIINVGRQAVDIVIDLNTQITELAKVSEATSSQIYDDFNSYAEIAKDVGGTISDTISATADWSRNGYNIPDSKELAEVALIYKNVGDGINIDQANEYLISTLRGFNLEAKDAMSIIDSINEVANNEPISASGIGEALQRSAAAFNAANTSLQESIALTSATNSVLQSPEKVGSMWTTVSARIRGAKTELEEAGLETDGMVESTSKLQALIKGMTGFDILEADGKTFKSIYDIIVGIGEEFQNLDDIDQAALLEALAGKRQSNALAAALNNIDILKKSYQEATNAEGSAMEEQRKYQESVQYSINRTKASLEELANDFLSSDFLKGLIDSGDKLINILDWIIDKFGVLGTLAGGAGIFAGIKNVGEGKNVSFHCFE